MKVDRTIILRDEGYEAYLALHPVGLNSHESEVFSKYGEPVVECGGIVVDKTLDVAFKTRPDNRAFPSQFPLRRLFPFLDPRANDNAIAFLATVTRRLEQARDQLLETHPTTIREDVMEI